MGEKTILKDVSLCSIVRDEKMNPAGGIQRFVESHVPFVEEAVIVDTGSIDGTREILEELENWYPHLKVFDHKFNRYGPSRNVSLKKAETKYALILDADELLTSEKPTNDWKNIQDYITAKEFATLLFDVENVYFDEYYTAGIHAERFFINDGDLFFEYEAGEYLNKLGGKESGISIKHFLPSLKGRILKQKNWYKKQFDGIYSGAKLVNNGLPAQTKGFKEWKRYNPKRENYI